VFVCYRAALTGIMTGVLLAVARVAGETAPLLFTSLGNNATYSGVGSAMSSLPVTIYQYAASAFDDWVAAGLDRRAADHPGRAGINIVARTCCAPAEGRCPMEPDVATRGPGRTIGTAGRHLARPGGAFPTFQPACRYATWISIYGNNKRAEGYHARPAGKAA
jgi:hypothetical protein